MSIKHDTNAVSQQQRAQQSAREEDRTKMGMGDKLRTMWISNEGKVGVVCGVLRETEGAF